MNSWSYRLSENMVVAVMVIACGRHGLWPSSSMFVAVVVYVCGRLGLWPSLSNPVNVIAKCIVSDLENI